MTHEQKEHIGYLYVLSLLSPASALGREKLRTLKPYTVSQSALLLQELDNVAMAAAVLHLDKKAFSAINHLLSQIKDLTKSIAALAGSSRPLDIVELFEVKNYLKLLQAIREDLRAHSGFGLSGITLKNTDPALDIVSKGQQGGFYISEAYSEKLQGIRSTKKEIEKAIQKAATAQERETLQQAHLLAAQEEEAEEAVVRSELSASLRPFAADMQHNATALATLDLIIQKAQLMRAHACVLPCFGESLSFSRLRNPLAADHLSRQGRQFTPLDFQASSGVTVITGANMGGKTIALKTIALNVLLALSGFPVFAESARLPHFDFVEIVSEDNQSLSSGLSRFGGEVLRVNELYAKAKGAKGLVLLDEFASGTNADEGGKIFRAVARAFRPLPGTVVMTTHLEGVACCADSHYQVMGLKNVAFDALKAQLDGHYRTGIDLIAKYMDYGLYPIQADAVIPKDAMRICDLLGLDPEILAYIDEEPS